MDLDELVVAQQIGRTPRRPWRVVRRCAYSAPLVIASPCVLEDGSRFPTLFWLTCPHLSSEAASEESAGATATWSARAAADETLAAALREADRAVRELRRAESAGSDPNEDVGIAGQADPLGVKCLHAHLAARLAGVADPIGEDLLLRFGATCPDGRCESIIAAARGAAPDEDEVRHDG